MRRRSRHLVTIGACATAGGIQALRNFADVEDFTRSSMPGRITSDTLATSTPIADACAASISSCAAVRSTSAQLLEVDLGAFLAGRKPVDPAHGVCIECKLKGNVCVMVAHGTPCLGPVTHAGCGALCPSYDRGCYGCYGPKETPNTHR